MDSTTRNVGHYRHIHKTLVDGIFVVKTSVYLLVKAYFTQLTLGLDDMAKMYITTLLKNPA